MHHCRFGGDCTDAIPPIIMNCLVWNSQGLGNPETVQSLKWQLRQKSPELVFLMETKLVHSEMEFLIRDLELDNCFSVDTDMSGGGKKGGISLLWKSDITVNVWSSSPHHINAEIDEDIALNGWRFCGVNGWHEHHQKRKTWELLRSLSSQWSRKWMCAGDFNEILYNFEKYGGPPREAEKMEAFHSAIYDCGLEDLGFTGSNFTWSTMQEGDNSVLERLDRALVSTEWSDAFPVTSAEHLMRIASDHHPIFISTKMVNRRRERKKKMFRVEEMWFQDDTCITTCSEAWSVVSGDPALCRRLQRCREALEQWEKEQFGNISKQLQECRTSWERTVNDQNGMVSPSAQKMYDIQMADLLRKEEMMWKQRSMALWLKKGDHNTAYFHRTANGRKKRDHIERLIREDGTVITEVVHIEKEMRNYFVELFTHREDIEMSEALEAVTCSK